MEPKLFFISSLPCALWGAASDRVIIAVHGAQSHKKDLPFRLLAETFGDCQVLSFDLPEHGERQNQLPLCKFSVCVQDLSAVFDYAASRWAHIGLFAVSMGAYCSLLACKNRLVKHAWFLSPVVNMEHLIKNMMIWFQTRTCMS